MSAVREEPGADGSMPRSDSIDDGGEPGPEKKVRNYFKVGLCCTQVGIRPYRHPCTKTGRSRPYQNRLSSGLEGG